MKRNINTESKEKKNYSAPSLLTSVLQLECGIAAASTSRIGVDPKPTSVQVEEWKSGDGFTDTDFTL